MMREAKQQRLQTPQGTETVYLEEACRHRQLLRLTEDHFSSWGYLPVLTPVFDYFETYRPLLDEAQIKRSYRFPDRNGELLVLRSDITLFLARQMGLAMKRLPRPQRVYYADSILRHQKEEDISSDEFFQSGAELIGSQGIEGDLEIILLLHELLENMKLPEWKIHIGSRALLNAVLPLESKEIPAIGPLLEMREREGLQELLEHAGILETEARIDLLFFLGTVAEFAENVEELTSRCGQPDSAHIAKAAEELLAIAKALSENISMENIRIDLSEHGGQPYYTGFTLRAYVEGSSTAVAPGGRYDKLLGHFGCDIPAAGFSLLMRKIQPLSRFNPQERALKTAKGRCFAERYRDARQNRKAGQRVILS